MNTFLIIILLLIILLLILIGYRTFTSSKCKQNNKNNNINTIPHGTTYKQPSKLPPGWDITGDNTTNIINPIQIGGISW